MCKYSEKLQFHINCAKNENEKLFSCDQCDYKSKHVHHVKIQHRVLIVAKADGIPENRNNIEILFDSTCRKFQMNFKLSAI